MKNHFIMSYSGNKRDEVETIINYINLNVETIVEPYCGTSAMSCYISTIYPLKYKYILNDNNNEIIKLYNLMKDETELNEFIDNINKLCFDENNNFISKEKYKDLINLGGLNGWFIGRKFYNITSGLYPIKPPAKLNKDNINNLPIIKFLRTENITITNNDAIETIKNNNNINTLILCDPPYLDTHNKTYYNNYNMNIYEWFTFNKSILINCYFILENMWIIKLLFRDCEINEYDKTYSGHKKKKVKHCVIKVSNQ
jgi:site-specific DNA-adenine methylase